MVNIKSLQSLVKLHVRRILKSKNANKEINKKELSKFIKDADTIINALTQDELKISGSLKKSLTLF